MVAGALAVSALLLSPLGERSALAQQTPPPRLRIEPPRPFGQGVVNLGGGAAFGSGSDGGFAFTVGLNGGYFVLDGLEPGVSTSLTVGSGIDTQLLLLPYIRWVLYRSFSFSPYLKVAGGGLFVFADAGTRKLGLYGGGGGVVFGLGGRLALNIEALALRATPKEDCPNDECTLLRFGLSLSVFFGGGSSAPTPRRGPPAPRLPGPEPDPTRSPRPAPANPRPAPAPQPTPSPGEVPAPAPDEPGLS